MCLFTCQKCKTTINQRETTNHECAPRNENDAFTTAARAAAERDWGTTVRAQRPAFIAGARWARDYPAAQEPTDAEVEVLARMTTEEVSGCGWEAFSEEARNFHRESARRRLTAARKARA